MSAPLLEVRDLDLFYGDAQALAGVSLEVAAGEIVTIVGANGAGKSSLIRTIHGIEKPAHGGVRFDGADITGWPSFRVCEAGIGHVAEGRHAVDGRRGGSSARQGLTSVRVESPALHRSLPGSDRRPMR